MSNSLRKYLAFTRVNIQNTLTYRGPMLLWVLGDIIVSITMINVVLSGNTDLVSGFTRNSLITYYVAVVFLGWLIGWYPHNSISDQIGSGRIIFTLKSPISVFVRHFFEEFGWHLISVFVGILACLILGFIYGQYLWFGFALANILFFVLSLVGAIFVTYSFSFCLGTLSFWISETSGSTAFFWFGRELFGGVALPFSFLPGVMSLVAQILPFRYMFSFPLEILFGQLTPAKIAIGFVMQLFWSLLLFRLYQFLWAKGRRYYAAFGN